MAKSERSLSGFTRQTDHHLTHKAFIEHEQAMSNIGLREQIVTFLLWAYGLSLACTFVLFFLQGFQVGGFNLPESILKWLGGAMIAEVAGLLGLVIGALFGKTKAS